MRVGIASLRAGLGAQRVIAPTLLLSEKILYLC